MSLDKFVNEEKDKILSWLKTYNSMNPDITINEYEDDINELCDNIIKRLNSEITRWE